MMRRIPSGIKGGKGISALIIYHFISSGNCFINENCYICGGVGYDWLCHRPDPTGKWERCGAIKPFYGGDRPSDGCCGDYRILCEFIGSRQRKKGDFRSMSFV